MKIFYQNLIDAAGVTFNATSQVSTLPASNLAHEFRKKVWRTGSTLGTERVVIDLGNVNPSVTDVIILDHTLTASDSNILLEANGSDAWGAPAFSQALAYTFGTIGLSFSLQNQRYWRLSFTKSSATESRDIGRLFLGTRLDTIEQPTFEGYDEQINDLVKKQKSIGGQTWSDLVDKYKSIRCEFGKMPNAGMDTLQALSETVGEGVSLFIQVDTVAPLDKYRYVKLAKALKKQVAGFDSSLYWDFVLEFEEQL